MPSSRKRIRDLKKELQHRYAWLNSVNHLPHSPKTALVWGHLATFVQTAQAIVLCARHNQFVGIPPLLRTAGECAVNSRMIVEKCTDDNSLLSAWIEKRRYVNKVTNILASEYSSGQISTAEEYKQKLNEKIEEARGAAEADSYCDWRIEKRWSEIGEDKFYHLCYTLLSGEVHCNPVIIDRRHATEVNGVPELIWCRHEEDESLFLIEMVFAFLRVCDPCFRWLSDTIEAAQQAQ